MILLLAACDALAPPAPYRLAIALGGHRVAEAPLDCHDGDATLELPAGEREASELVIRTDVTFAAVELEGRTRWLEVPSPLDEEHRAFLLGLATSPGCPAVRVMPFVDPRRVAVVDRDFVRVVDLESRMVRNLDATGAMLEGCEMERDRQHLRCHLDLSWDEARFDADGHEIRGSFQPWWQH